MKLVTTKFKSGGLHEKHVVATWNLGNHLSICFWAQGNQESKKKSNAQTVQQIHISWQQYTQDNYNNTRGQPTTITHKTT